MIIARLYGGMGNQMFTYATGRALAIKNGVSLKLDDSFLRDRTPRPKSWNFVFRIYDLHIFNIASSLATRKELPWQYLFYLWGMPKLALDALRRRLIPNLGREKSFNFDPTILSLGPNTFLEGYWQSYKYFEGIADTIRNDFQLKELMSEKSTALLQEIRSCSSVCINVRRADFVTSDFHGTCDKTYYDRGLKMIAEKYPIDKVYIFSDDVEWCRENLPFDYPTAVVSHEYAGPRFGEYLYLMVGCKHFVIPNSSFAWWAAWLNTDKEKMVVAPKSWFLDTTIDTQDLCPPDWIRI